MQSSRVVGYGNRVNYSSQPRFFYSLHAVGGITEPLLSHYYYTCETMKLKFFRKAFDFVRSDDGQLVDLHISQRAVCL